MEGREGGEGEGEKERDGAKESIEGGKKESSVYGVMPIASLVSLASYHLCLLTPPADIVRMTVRTYTENRHANPYNARARTHIRMYDILRTQRCPAAVAVALYREHRSNL